MAGGLVPTLSRWNRAEIGGDGYPDQSRHRRDPRPIRRPPFESLPAVSRDGGTRTAGQRRSTPGWAGEGVNGVSLQFDGAGRRPRPGWASMFRIAMASPGLSASPCRARCQTRHECTRGTGGRVRSSRAVQLARRPFYFGQSDSYRPRTAFERTRTMSRNPEA